MLLCSVPATLPFVIDPPRGIYEPVVSVIVSRGIYRYRTLVDVIPTLTACAFFPFAWRLFFLFVADCYSKRLGRPE